MPQKSIVEALVLVLLFSLCGCGGDRSSSAKDSPTGKQTAGNGPRVESLVAVDTGQMLQPELEQWIDLINDSLSPCGDPVSLGQCASKSGSSCKACMPAAQYLARLVTEGYPSAEIEELYRLRYDPSQKHTIQASSSPVRGAPMATVHLLVFSDFQCPYCRKAASALEDQLKQHPSKIQIRYLHYPLPSHDRATPAAKAAIAAAKQGKFWAMYDLIFDNQLALQDTDLLGYAKELGLDLARFKADIAAEATQATIERDHKLGKKLGVDGTPSLFVNGRAFRESWDALGLYVQEELKR